MTDAREIIAPAHPADIIAQAIRMFSRTEGAGRVAEIGLNNLHSAGFRILGPDEVDPVTVEKCAEVANIGGDVITCQQCNASSQVQFGEKATLAEAWNRRTDLPSGYVVLSPDEVRGIRDEALEEAARTADLHPGIKFTNHNSRQDWRPPCRFEIAAAIRSLKGGRDAQ